MHPRFWITASLAASLGACALAPTGGSPREGFDPTKVKLQAPCTVNVLIDEKGNVAVDAEPVRTSRCENDRKITLLLDPDSEFTFDVEPNGIRFPAAKNPTPPDPPPNCERKQSGKRYDCKFRGKTGYHWKYTIALLKNGVPDAILDPHMIND